MDRIFHYTSIETFEKIIENKTIRLNALKDMDDMYEGISADFGDLSCYCYASCWTKEEYENIPLWYMYTDKMKGIRIEADSDFLELKEDKNGKVINITNDNTYASRITYEDNKNGDFLVHVKYQDSYESCIIDNRGFINEHILDIGLIKPIVWEFQKECRFRVFGINKNILENSGLYFMDAIINKYHNDIDFIDIKFDINKLKNANFVLGPCSEEADYTKVKQLIENSIPNFTGKIIKSSLKIRFK